jgi:hypothetical protein
MNTDKLLALLKKAIQKVEDLEKHTIIELYDGTDLKTFFNNIIKDIKNNSITINEKFNLYSIFTPTSLWDDNFTDINFTNEIFNEIEKLYYEEIMINMKIMKL